MNKITSGLAGLVFAGLTLAGCSQNSVNLVDFQVPESYFQVSQNQLQEIASFWAAQEPKVEVISQQAWSSSNQTTATDLFSAVAPQVPQIYFLQRELAAVEISAVQQEQAVLADLVLPLSLRTTADGLEVGANEISSQSDMLTLQQELSWDFQGTTQSMRIYAVVDVDSKLLELLWLRCSDTCMIENSKSIEAFWDSISLEASGDA